MTTPSPTLPRKHLHTFPVGTVLPDPTTVEDGYPFLLETGAGPALTRTLYQNQAGVWKVVSAAGGGGGGGGIAHGPLVPVPAGKDGRNPDWWITPDHTQANPHGHTPSVNRGGVITGGAPTGARYKDPAGAALNSVFKSYDIQPGNDDNHVFTINVPNDYSGEDPDNPNGPGQRGFRLDFRLASTWTGYHGCYVGIYCDAYPYDDVYRNMDGWSAVDAADVFQGLTPSDPPYNTGHYYGPNGNPPDYYGPLFWAEDRLNNNQWRDISLTFPAGTSRVYISVWTDERFTGTANLLMTDVRGTYLDTSLPDGSMFLEESTQALWLLDKKVIFDNLANKVAADADPTQAEGYAGSGWYKMSRGNVVSWAGADFDPSGVDGETFHLGYHYFSDVSDLRGNKFGSAKYSRVGMNFNGAIPAAADQLAFEDNFIRSNNALDRALNDPYIGSQNSPYVVGTPGNLDVPPAPTVAALSNGAPPSGIVFDGSTTFTYAWTFKQDFGNNYGDAHLEGVVGASASATPTATQQVRVRVPDFHTRGATGAALYRSADGGATYRRLVGVSFAGGVVTSDDSSFSVQYNFGTSQYEAYDTGKAATGSTPPSTDNTVDVALVETGIQWFKSGPGRGIVFLNPANTLPTTEMTIDGDDNVGFQVFLGGDDAQFWFRSDGTDQNGYYISLFYSGDPYRVRLHNVVAGVDSVLATSGVLGYNGTLVGCKITVDDTVTPNTVTVAVKGTLDADYTVVGLTDEPLTPDHDTRTGWGVRLPNYSILRRWRMRDYGDGYSVPHQTTRLSHDGVPYVVVPPGLGTDQGGYLGAYSIALAAVPKNGVATSRLGLICRPSADVSKRIYLDASNGAVLFSRFFVAGGLPSNDVSQTDPIKMYTGGDRLEVWHIIHGAHEGSQPWTDTAPLPVSASISFGG